MGRIGPGHTSMAICSWMLMVAFSPRRRRVIQAAPPRPGAARPGTTPARGRLSRPGGTRRGLRASPGCPRTALTRLLPAPRRPARVSARGRQAGGGPSPRHPVATKQCECAGCAGGRAPSEERAEQVERHHTHSHSHWRARWPGTPRARTHTHTHSRVFHSLTLAGQRGETAEHGPAGCTLTHSRVY